MCNCCSKKIKKNCLLCLIVTLNCNANLPFAQWVRATVTVTIPDSDFTPQTATTTGGEVCFIIPLKYANQAAHVEVSASGYVSSSFDTYPCSADLCVQFTACGSLLTKDQVLVNWSQVDGGPWTNTSTNTHYNCANNVFFINNVTATATSVPTGFTTPAPFQFTLGTNGFTPASPATVALPLDPAWTCTQPPCCIRTDQPPPFMIASNQLPATLYYNDTLGEVTLTEGISFASRPGQSTWRGCAMRTSAKAFPTSGLNNTDGMTFTDVPVMFEAYCSIGGFWVVDAWVLTAREYDADNNFVGCHLYPMVGSCLDIQSMTEINGCYLTLMNSTHLFATSCIPAMAAIGNIQMDNLIYYDSTKSYIGTLVQ